MQNVLLYGVSAIIPSYLEYLGMGGSYRIAGLCLHEHMITERQAYGLPVFPFETILETHPPNDFQMHIVTPMGKGNFRKRKQAIAEKAEELGYHLFSFVHPMAYVSPTASLGDNVFLSPFSFVQTYARVGKGVYVGGNTYISHESTIGDWSFLSACVGIAGKTSIGKYCFIGVNCTIRDRMTIGDEAIIGGGAVVLRDVPPKGVVRAAEGILLDRKSDSFGI